MNETIDEEKCTQLLNDFSKVIFKEDKHPTFLKIINEHKRENTWSNILAFYFDPKKEHKLCDLMLKSFFEALGKKMEIKNVVKVCPEFSTDSRKRIDLVIIADNFVLGIENKVDYWLNNDLEDYRKKIDKIAEDKRCPSFKVILSKNQYYDEHGFVNLTYERFIKYIEKNLSDYEAKANAEYLIFFKDFLRNIKNTINHKEMIENPNSLKCFQYNFEAIEELTTKFLQFKDEVRIKFGEIYNAIDLSKLNSSFKEKHGDEAIICKEGIFGQDENGFPIFRILINNGRILSYWVYLESQMSQIYCYAEPQLESHKEIFLATENFGLGIEISEETKDAANSIVNQIDEIVENVFVN